MAGERYAAEYGNFNGKYNIGIDISDHYDILKQFKSIDNFTFNADPRRAAQTLYMDTLTDALTSYLENKTKMENGKAYDMSDVSIGDFIEDFERVMQAKYLDELEEGKAPTRVPFEGASFGGVANAAWNRMSGFNKPLPDVWADSILNKTFSLSDMMNITEESRRSLSSADLENLGDKRKDLANIVMAKQAMEKVRAGRGFWWKLWAGNWSRNSEEKKYLEELKNRIQGYRENRLPVDEVEAKVSALSGVYDKLRTSVRNHKAKSTAQTETQPNATENQPVKISVDLDKEQKVNETEKKQETVVKTSNEPNVEQRDAKPKEKEKEPEQRDAKPQENEKNEEQRLANLKEKEKTVEQLAKNPNVKAKAVEQFKQWFNKKANIPAGLVPFFSQVLYDHVLERAQEMWGALNEKDEAAREKQIAEGAINVFISAHTHLGTLKLDFADHLAAAQKITDMMINQFSPVAFDDKYAKYGNGYFLNTADLDKIMLYSKTDDYAKAHRIFHDAKEDFENGKVRLDLSEYFDEMENDVQKSPKVDEPAVPGKEKIKE